MMDKATELVANALGQARVVRKCLEAKAIPLLQPRQRTFAVAISRRIAARTIVSEAFVRDLEAFIILLGQEVKDGSSLAWHGHEHDPDFGYHVMLRTDRAQVLLVVHNTLVDLTKAIEAALDTTEAYTIANALFGPS